VEAFFCTSHDGRKNYVKGRTMTWSAKFSVDVLTGQLAIELNVGNNQLVDVWYLDKVLGQHVRILHDDQH